MYTSTQAHRQNAVDNTPVATVASIIVPSAVHANVTWTRCFHLAWKCFLNNIIIFRGQTSSGCNPSNVPVYIAYCPNTALSLSSVPWSVPWTQLASTEGTFRIFGQAEQSWSNLQRYYLDDTRASAAVRLTDRHVVPPFGTSSVVCNAR